LDRSEAHIRYCFTADLDVDAVTAAVQTLSREERTRYDRLRSSHRRRDFAVAHGLLRQLLSSVGGVSPLADFGFIFEDDTSLRLEPPAGGRWRFGLGRIATKL